jgi:nucleotide-binding universal stress UspA family protein
MRTLKLLVAIDGSTHTLAVIRYIAATVDPKRVTLRLLHVMNPAPESVLDEEPDLAEKGSDLQIQDWQRDHRRRMEAFAADAQKIACDAGIAKDAIRIDIKRRERGIARDIFNEAQRGYDAVVLGRRGENPSRALPIGSVANKIAHLLHHFPVWIAAEPAVSPSGVLVALDGSEGARRALDHAAAMIGPQCSTLCLFHAIRGGDLAAGVYEMEDSAGGGRPESLAQERLGRTERSVKVRMDQWVASLAGRIAGSPRMIPRIVTGVPSRAAAILQEAAAGGYGTVVVGRRGVSRTPEFAMGRVCAKILQIAQQTTVWIVN